MSSEIVQIIFAQPGWEAVYAYEQFDDEANFDEDVGDYVEDGGYAKVQLACWALAKRDGKTVVVGMIQNTHEWQDATLTCADDERNNFIGYNYPGCELDWTFKATAYRTPSHSQGKK
jgi:hypothetical protein